jgi:hypothetical protein
VWWSVKIFMCVDSTYFPLFFKYVHILAILSIAEPLPIQARVGLPHHDDVDDSRILLTSRIYVIKESCLHTHRERNM